MARTRIKSSNIENNSVKNEDISSTEGLDASKIISGTTLPAVDASQLLNTLDSISDNSIPFQKLTDSSIPLTKLFTANSGTAGQLLKKNASGELEFVDDQVSDVGASTVGGDLSGTVNNAQINDNVIGISELNVSGSGTNGQALVTDGSTGLSWADVTSDPTMGGDLSGTASNAQINNGVIGNAQISDVDASKISGTLPHGVSSGGTLGSLHKSSWADDNTVIVNLTNSATGIGNAVVKVYEEYLDPAKQNITNNDWDLTTNNDIGGEFHLNNFTQGATITPQATTGTGVQFIFTGPDGASNTWETLGFSAGSYTSGEFYTIKNSQGNGVAKITSTSGNIATCDIIEDFPNTNPLILPLVRNCEFTDGKFQLSGKTDIDTSPQMHGGSFDISPSHNDNDSNLYHSDIIGIDDTRALTLWNGTDDGNHGSNDYGVAIVKMFDDPSTFKTLETPHNSSPSNFDGYSTDWLKGNSIFGVTVQQVTICKLSEERFIIAGVSTNNATTFKLASLTIPSASALTQEVSVQGSISDIGPPSPHNNQNVRDVRLARISDTRFMAVASVQSSAQNGHPGHGSNWVPFYSMHEVDASGNLSQLAYHELLDGDNGTAQGIGSPNEGTPIFQIFGANDPTLNTLTGVYIFYDSYGENPNFIQTKINRNTGSGNGPQSEYLYSTVAGAFKDSFGNSNGLTRIAQPNKHCLIPFERLDNQDLYGVYMWADSTHGIEAAVLRIAPDVGGNLNNLNSSARPLWFGGIPVSNGTPNFSGYGGSATNVTSEQCTTLSGTLYATGSFSSPDTMHGLYSYKQPGVNQLKQGKFVGGDDFNTQNTSFGHGSNLTFTYLANISGHSTTGNVDKMASTTLGVHDHTHGQEEDVLPNCSLVTYKHGDDHIYAKIVRHSTEVTTYVSAEWATTISGVDTIDTTNYEQINSITPTQTGGNDDILYAFATDIDQDSGGEITGGTFWVLDPTYGLRNVLTSRASVHGGTDTEWYYNNAGDGSAAWDAAWIGLESNNYIGPGFQTGFNIQANSAFRAAIKANSSNGMTKTDIDFRNSAGWQDFPTATNKLAVAIGIRTYNSSVTPTVDKVTITYGSPAVHRDKTHEYTIDIVDVDTIEVTSPNSGGPRNARIYVTS